MFGWFINVIMYCYVRVYNYYRCVFLNDWWPDSLSKLRNRSITHSFKSVVARGGGSPGNKDGNTLELSVAVWSITAKPSETLVLRRRKLNSIGSEIN